MDARDKPGHDESIAPRNDDVPNLVVPAQAGTQTPCVRFYQRHETVRTARLHSDNDGRAHQHMLRRMGPRLRGDDRVKPYCNGATMPSFLNWFTSSFFGIIPVAA